MTKRNPSRAQRRAEDGLTVLELMVVLAIVVGLTYLGFGAVRWIRKERLVQSALEIGAVMSRTSQLAAETSMLHRVVFDLDAQAYRIEVCQGGPAGISRTPEPPEQGEEARRKAVDSAKQKLASVPQNAMPTNDDPERAEEMALALAGQLAHTRVCTLAIGQLGDAEGRDMIRKIDTSSGIKIKQVYVQHLEDPADKGLVAIYFFPLGSAEKAIIEVVDSDGAVYSVLLAGLTSRVEIQDGAVRDVDSFMMRDAEGDTVEER